MNKYRHAALRGEIDRVNRIAAGIAVSLLAACCCPALAASGGPPADLAAAFGALPQVSAVTLSRGGQVLAWIQRDGAHSSVVVYNYAAHRVERVLRVDPPLRPRSLNWDGGGILLVNVNMTIQPGNGLHSPHFVITRTLALNVKTGHTQLLLMSGSDRQYVSGAILLLADPHRRHGVIMYTLQLSRDGYESSMGTLIPGPGPYAGWLCDLYAVDPHSGDDKIIGYGNRFTTGWVVNLQGNPVARIQYHPLRRRLLLEVPRGSDWVPIYSGTGLPLPQIMNVSLDGTTIDAIVPDGDGVQQLLAIPVAGGAAKNLLPGVRRSVLSIGTSTGLAARLLGVTLAGPGGARFVWLDAAARRRHASVAQAFPGRSVNVYDASRNGKEVLAEVQSPTHPPVYYLTDFAVHRAMVVGRAYPQLAHVHLGSVRAIHYRTRSGREVSATVFLPPGGGRDLPLVMLAPGGPEIDRPRRFDWLAQYLAESGYAVLRPELSWQGISGRETYVGTLWQWDGAPHGYALDGVRVLAKEGLIDPHRVCIVGVSSGGYAALAGAAFSPQTYVCAVSINGISDLPAFVRYEDHVVGGATTTYWRAKFGATSDSRLMARSPVHAVAAIRAPVLLMHCVHDNAVLFSQSQEMANALRGLDKPVTLVRLPGMDQSLSRGVTRIAALRAIGPFLHRYLH